MQVAGTVTKTGLLYYLYYKEATQARGCFLFLVAGQGFFSAIIFATENTGLRLTVLLQHFIEVFPEIQQLVVDGISPVCPVVVTRPLNIIVGYLLFQQFLVYGPAHAYNTVFGSAIHDNG